MVISLTHYLQYNRYLHCYCYYYHYSQYYHNLHYRYYSQYRSYRSLIKDTQEQPGIVGKVYIRAQVAHHDGVYPDFCSIK